MNCQREFIPKVMSEYLADFDDVDEATTATAHLS